MLARIRETEWFKKLNGTPKENVLMALANLRTNKMRSILTVLGIVVGVATVVVIASILTGMRSNLEVMIQEFGVYNKTPHTVTLAFLIDLVSVFNKYKVGYAMWNLIGTMGIIDSERADCTYESYRGKQLDREMATIMRSTGN